MNEKILEKGRLEDAKISCGRDPTKSDRISMILEEEQMLIVKGHAQHESLGHWTVMKCDGFNGFLEIVDCFGLSLDTVLGRKNKGLPCRMYALTPNLLLESSRPLDNVDRFKSISKSPSSISGMKVLRMFYGAVSVNI